MSDRTERFVQSTSDSFVSMEQVNEVARQFGRAKAYYDEARKSVVGFGKSICFECFKESLNKELSPRVAAQRATRGLKELYRVPGELYVCNKHPQELKLLGINAEAITLPISRQNKSMVDVALQPLDPDTTECPICQKNFPTSALLKKHVGMAHPQTAMMPASNTPEILCKFCNETFPTVNSFDLHLRNCR